MPIFGGESEPGADKFIPCPDCGEDEVISQSDGLFKKTEFVCNSCSKKHRALAVLKVHNKSEKVKKPDKNKNRDYSDHTGHIATLVDNAEGPGVTSSRLQVDGGVILDALDEGEQPHCLLIGSTICGIEIEGGNEIQRTGGKDAGFLKTFDNKLTLKHPLGVPNLTIVTDKRVLGIHPLTTGVDEYSIPFESIDAVAVDPGLYDKIQVATRGQTYYFEVRAKDSEYMNEVVDFIRQNQQESRTTRTPEATPTETPLNKLKQLGELHAEGILSDEEFRNKKESLLEEI